MRRGKTALFSDDNQFHHDSTTPGRLQLFGSTLNARTDLPNNVGIDNISSLSRPGKRSQGIGEIGKQHKLQISSNNLYPVRDVRSTSIPNPNAVSTGLRLFYDEDEHNSSITSASGGLPSLPTIMSLDENMKAKIEIQHEELNHYIRLQEEELAKGMKVMMQRHAASVVSAIERGTSQKLMEKERMIENLNKKNMELEEQIKHVGSEVQVWQYRAQYNESMVNTLKNSLHQAMGAAGRNQLKEGCGDSEVDDAASWYNSNALETPASGKGSLTMACKGCGSKKICMLMLPCRHLCLCKDCDASVHICPICLSLKTASAEVYMV